jgi:hypothetical protein
LRSQTFLNALRCYLKKGKEKEEGEKGGREEEGGEVESKGGGSGEGSENT